MLAEKHGRFYVRHAPTTIVQVVGLAIVGPMQLVYALDDLRGWAWLFAIGGVMFTLAGGLGVWMLLSPRTVIDPQRRVILWGARTLGFDDVAEVRLSCTRDTDSESWHLSVVTRAGRAVFEERVAAMDARIAFAKAHPGQGITPEQLAQERTTAEALLRRGTHRLGSADAERKARAAAVRVAKLTGVAVVDETHPD